MRDANRCQPIMTFFAELKRRNVFRIGAAYVLFAWVLLQGADFALDLIGAPNWIIQALSIIVAIGLPLALIIAWAFELTPEGIKREKDVDRSQSITPRTGRKLDRVIIVVLALAVTYLLIDKLVLQDLVKQPDAGSVAAGVDTPAPPAEDGSPSVAVLPFVNMSGDVENEYFSDGLTETLLHVLSQLPELRVAARTSSFAFKGKNASIGEIAGALGVAHVLEGSVQKANDRVRVTAQLIRANDGFHVWSQNYTRPLEDIFAIQDEIATDVAAALGSSLLGAEEAEIHVVNTTNLSAYDSYLKGLEQQNTYSYGGLDDAENHFKQALARDPGFTDARLALVRNYIIKFSTGMIDSEELYVLSDPLISQVRESEPGNLLARALELSQKLVNFDPSRSAAEVRKIVDELQALLLVMPTDTLIRINVATTLNGFFRQEQQAIDVLQAGLMIDPLEPEFYRWLGRVYIQTGRLEEARASLLRTIELAPDNPNGYSTMAELEQELDNLPGVLDYMRQAIQVDPQDHELAAAIARDLYLLRLPEEGDYWLSRVQALAPGSGLARSLEVSRAAARGETGQAIALATAVIAEQFDNRQGSFGRVIFYYADAMLQEGRAREAYDFLVSVRPEITQYDQIAQGVPGLLMQWASLGLMAGFETFENRQAAWSQFRGELDSTGIPWNTDPSSGNITWDFLMQGEVEQAVDHYLEFELNEPLATNLDRHRKRFYALYGPVYEDPRVAAKLNEDAERFTALREEVLEMLRQPKWENF
ncbi:MAG: tetratricopeptide repeat protein [Xanthomonadales bacterium]|jgi:TolB-like protein/thioredoxin-like negative regulator of GroEL|nr:tetratricopeptide repeat protein [Xanthomonadales bacterium]